MLLEPYTLRGLTLRNRIVVSPMCQYSCTNRDGLATDWHMVHLGSRAVGGAGLVLTEATAVTPEGRISPEDLGLWSDAHADVLAPIVRFMQAQGAAVGIQLAHAGRKASTSSTWTGGRAVADADGGWTPLGPTDVPASANHRGPRAMDSTDLTTTVQAFASAAVRASRIGVDVVEIHAAHGYLLHSFLSPLSNHRDDGYGGSLQQRARLLFEVVDAVRGVWPAQRPLFVRISATDWVENGWMPSDSVELATHLAKRGVDLVDCSSGGVALHAQIPVGPNYQVPFAERIRREAGVPTGAVGLITMPEQAESILQSGQADLIFIAREFLRDPYFALRAARELGAPSAVPLPPPYWRSVERR